ncbi:metal ABC transporter ATP-binding protein [Pontiella agarivorans]|uniref:ABC transporter ATP-binding protein n=1 Tax=Pontiella agarivorans TaxID=3038953 RepID=A0ABU5MUQ2_9BACT|nr:ABC transporter ATP-binding protein [Pontiella agarivorans]MDZ8117868.1 ABC transporter ATP-binding protein [Pontiella agarivorans]
MSIPIHIENLNFSYGPVAVLENANVSIGEREFISVVGPNGGGKTTLLKIMLGLLEPQSGSVSIFGKTPDLGRKWIGYLPQYANLDAKFPVTALDVVLMGRLGKTRSFGFYSKTDREAARAMLARVGLNKQENRPLSALSGGQQQRVLIARALVSEPKLLLLDEPTSSLDDYVEQELYDLLQELNKELTIIVVSHDVAYVSRYVEKVVCVNREVHIHPVSEVDENIIHDMYGEHVHAVRHDQEHDNG